MKLNRLPNRMMVTALLASVLISGAAMTTMARDRDGQRQGGSRYEQRDQRHQPNSSYRQESQRKDTHMNRVVVHRPSQRIIHALPTGYRTIRTGDRHYYYHSGVFYNRHANGYVIVSAPRFHQLPRYAHRVVVNRTVYYVCDDVYYVPRCGYYEVCETPYVERSIEFNAGPVRIVLTDSERY